MDDSSGDLGLAPDILSPSQAPSASSASAISTSTTSAAIRAERRTTFTRSVDFPRDAVDPNTLARLSRWIVCCAQVEFDLDLGPDLDNVYPYTKFSDSVKANIAFSSLPEGDLPTAGAHTFSWRIPMPETQEDEKGKGRESGEALFGFVYFVQEKNPALRRGYSQRSLVIITHLPSYVGLFSALVGVLGPLHFKHQDSSGGMIETACRNIASWPDPTPGAILELPFLGTIQTVDFPLPGQSQWHSSSTGLDRRPSISPAGVYQIPASLPLTPLSTFFHGSPPLLSFGKILLLWELVLLGEPIVIYSADPRTGSELVWHLRNLIRPINPGGDFRPYFHMHDIDYMTIAQAGKPVAGAIICITNPHLLSLFKSWPHILRATPIKTDSVLPGLTTTRKRHVKKDAKATREIEDCFARGDYLGCDALVLKHVRTLTEKFLSPLNRYFGTLPTVDTSLHSPRSAGPFQSSTFFTSLKSHGTPLSLRATASSLSLSANTSTTTERFYQRFVVSPNFKEWLEGRRSATDGEVRKRYLTRLEEADVELWAGGKGDQEVEELVKRLEKEAIISEHAVPNGDGTHSASHSPERERNRGARLRTQVARLKTLQNERAGSGAESDSDVASLAGGI